MSKSKNKQKILYISGMTCVSCENLISESLKEFEQIKNLQVDHKSHRAIFQLQAPIQNDKLFSKIRELGYEPSWNEIKKIEKKKVTWQKWLMAILIVALLVIVFRYFSTLGVFNGLDGEIGMGMALLIGVIASMSTCLAIVGAVVMSFGAKYETNETSFYQRNLKPHLLFHFGRLLTFFILGGILGIVGSWVSLSTNFMVIFTVFIAVILVWLGLNILGIVPSLTTIFHLPKSSFKTWNQLKNSEHPWAPMILGGITFVLPCGFTQSMQLFAISSGSFWIGGVTMFLFALGTMPVLLGLGVATTRFKNMKFQVLEKVIGMVVILFAIYTLSTGLAVAGINFNLFDSKTEGQVQISNSDVQRIKMEIDFNGFSPNVFRIKKDVPVEWVINAKRLSGCTSEIIIPSMNFRKKLEAGENLIKFTATKAGTVNFSCWMGMVRGKFIVE
ncbi:hypothetical protein A2533_03070 [Candidatus Falkowbacteria bacterium RIFOXYD2_FULL_35_9]|uniref:HMA domain-containing protein n=1 Tax=Candidatus Falkowbacteria bacterium RIFOXYC2_FULL_36_12 TaxID=1798002 RepID=A0A1F5SVY1_9BACT|nr:MAG: hypothetical protein A2478_00385 [Candidatus Falkowbacteria bacterium RIFOXYC2_FULL_36_12]OGF31554.1 MAG: hypothetical protein A2300_03685 [Candidatus Falkowbacteria bacterium RIFOXYB2_FULL_35_7]OGF33597.1 MAG: hypothetical protein A2223_03520 [Candidatus Falkowbacteria bacterium RIFOXYA2_FULL_35_8]OGF46955.1 MAG: hypothetical protein A2533_03070 [Candidatus Falkowbacteria bacterium RIFOXYD2_FULL_35_9]